MALWSSIDSDVIRIIAHIVHLGLEQIIFLDEFDAVAHQVAQTFIDNRVYVSVVPTAKAIVSSCANIRINKSALP